MSKNSIGSLKSQELPKNTAQKITSSKGKGKQSTSSNKSRNKSTKKKIGQGKSDLKQSVISKKSQCLAPLDINKKKFLFKSKS